MSDPTIINPANNYVSNDAPLGTDKLPFEDPPPPEDEDFRSRQLEAEVARRERQSEAFGVRQEDAIKRFKGVNEIGDTPGSALAGDNADTVTGDAGTPVIRDGGEGSTA